MTLHTNTLGDSLDQDIEHFHYTQKILLCSFLVVLSTLIPLLSHVTTVLISVTMGNSDSLMQIVSQSWYEKQYPMYFSGLNSAFILDGAVPRNIHVIQALSFSHSLRLKIMKLVWCLTILVSSVESYINIYKYLEPGSLCVVWAFVTYASRFSDTM